MALQSVDSGAALTRGRSSSIGAVIFASGRTARELSYFVGPGLRDCFHWTAIEVNIAAPKDLVHALTVSLTSSPGSLPVKRSP